MNALRVVLGVDGDVEVWTSFDATPAWVRTVVTAWALVLSSEMGFGGGGIGDVDADGDGEEVRSAGGQSGALDGQFG